ncbi:hypothetical protein [Ferdinandcohnia sp. Marseille-Q9671]
MKCLCKEDTRDLKIEGDFSADPIWCAKCSCNIELEDFPISDEVKRELEQWAKDFGTWLDLASDTIVKGGDILEKKHNQKGELLTKKVQEQLPTNNITFSPSALIELYKENGGTQ